jgi:hypothetical protein
MLGERFSRLYLRPGDPVPDSAKARHRIGALFREPVFSDHAERLADYLGQQVGVVVPSRGKYSSYWLEFIRECPTADFLDAIPIVYRYLFWHAGDEAAHWWRDAVRKVFAEESLAYDIDDVGGIHPAVDREFQRNIVSAIATLRSERYQKFSDLIESASNQLNADPPNYKQAWRSTISAVEGLCGLMFPYARFGPDEIKRSLQVEIQRTYPGDATAQRAAQNMLVSFQQWIEASDNYRHKPGGAEDADPPADIAIWAISFGAALLRWLAGLDENRHANRIDP